MFELPLEAEVGGQNCVSDRIEQRQTAVAEQTMPDPCRPGDLHGIKGKPRTIDGWVPRPSPDPLLGADRFSEAFAIIAVRCSSSAILSAVASTALRLLGQRFAVDQSL
jgi:hypothetical protein